MATKPIDSMDLTQRPPRSPRVRLGGYAILARMLDKGRATLAGRQGEYHYDCPTDRHWLDFVAVKAAALKQQLAAGKGDGEILEWVRKNAKHHRTAAWVEQRAPGDVEMREWFNGQHAKLAPKRTDIVTWFDLLDLDDYVSFGGKA
jgi:membrane protein required for beta-lactamase induction